ncbi:MAG: SAM-dependent methyltransferase [Verrucomicrobia bacterium]|nr:SAM-dependent methyltransferase [Verrucomicrobiota bacterium]
MPRFDHFMHRAMHDPEHGYYARRIVGIGRRGDFTTAPMLSAAPARAIAAWAARALCESGCRDLIEIGPGEGTLAAAVHRALPWHVRWRTRLHLVESSPVLAADQQRLLGRRARWHRDMPAALAACAGRAVIFSNELVDAFPVRRFQNTAEGWRELALVFDADHRVREVLLPPAPMPPSSSFQQPHPVGQWIEVHDSYREWLTAWLPAWHAGRLLTIDYGATAADLYHRRPRGTLRAYLCHQRLEGPAIYDIPGRQDLTADVNFTDLTEWSAPWCAASSLLPFREFIQAAADPSNPTDQALLNEHGAGTAYLVLDQSRSAP